MARTSQWEHNDKMWEFAADMRKGGMKYSEIHGLLAFKEKARFGLVNVPSQEVIKYNLTKRRLLSINPSDLPQDELEEHHKGLVFMGGVFRYQIAPPPDRRSSRVKGEVFKGFDSSRVYRPHAKTEIEEEIKEEWDGSDSPTHEPEMFSRYAYFREHMDCTLTGRKVNNALDAVKRTAIEYNLERRRLLQKVKALVDAAADDQDDPDARVMSLFLSTKTRRQLSAKQQATQRRFESNMSLAEMKTRAIRKGIESPEVNSELTKKLRKLTTAQNNLETALKPVELIRKMVRDSECELCSSKPLERADEKGGSHQVTSM